VPVQARKRPLAVAASAGANGTVSVVSEKLLPELELRLTVL
jgi:hypothetical protein